jgi:glutamate 5-kinase
MDEAVKHVSTDISWNGTWGMGTKFLALKKIMQQWGNGMIADGKEKDIIQKIFQGGGQKTVFHGKEL